MATRARSANALVIATLALALALLPAAAAARDEGPGGLASAGSLIGTLIYSPVKIAFAASGVVVGSLAWLWSFGSRRVASPIFRTALQGDYVVLPEHLTGDRDFEFRGR